QIRLAVAVEVSRSQPTRRRNAVSLLSEVIAVRGSFEKRALRTGLRKAELVLDSVPIKVDCRCIAHGRHRSRPGRGKGQTGTALPSRDRCAGEDDEIEIAIA